MALNSRQSDYQDVYGDMNRIMVPLLGLLLTLFLIALVVLLALKPRFVTFLKWFLVILLAFQMFATTFVWFSTLWEVGLQLFVVALFGLFALFSRDGGRSTHLLIFTTMSLYDFLVVIGKLSFLGYNAPLISALDRSTCGGFYFFDTSTDAAQCTGYLNFLRFMVYVITLAQPVQLFISYLLYRSVDETGEVGGEPSDYGKISGSEGQ